MFKQNIKLILCIHITYYIIYLNSEPIDGDMIIPIEMVKSLETERLSLFK